MEIPYDPGCPDDCRTLWLMGIHMEFSYEISSEISPGLFSSSWSSFVVQQPYGGTFTKVSLQTRVFQLQLKSLGKAAACLKNEAMAEISRRHMKTTCVLSGSDPEAIRKLLKLQPSLTGATHEKFVKRDWNIEGCRKAALQLPFASIHSQAILSTPSVYFAAAPSSACPVSCTDTFNMPGLWLVVILTSQSRLWQKKSF